ncbi:type II toxin-antitoxin system YafQ family toxin [Pseudomonas caspiana]|uniref:Type II toxin-antitoxin system YafQ family toxin n=1 Tax=Pseudomonas caspiana TaxID=1451454 RepID=A0A1Y3P6N9_9PSED|nr:type II toxin-antitoxin system YafQ family toxin [Pseudomonas caspiana]OUM75505.1 hypothetical protein AUC60_04705 [Pseudomonas caspiana]
MAKPPKKVNTKRAARPKRCTYTSTFNKSWDRYKRAGVRDMTAASDVMAMIFQGKTLPAEYEDHELTGDWDGSRECHIGGDFLLVYQLSGDLVTFVDLGSHSELFG